VILGDDQDWDLMIGRGRSEWHEKGKSLRKLFWTLLIALVKGRRVEKGNLIP